VPVVRVASGGGAVRIAARPREEHGDRGDGDADCSDARDERRPPSLTA
jgi:hypothetical protein